MNYTAKKNRHIFSLEAQPNGGLNPVEFKWGITEMAQFLREDITLNVTVRNGVVSVKNRRNRTKKDKE